MRRTLATIVGAVSIGVTSVIVGSVAPAAAQDVVVEEIRPDVPNLIDTLTNDELIDLWYDIVMASPDPAGEWRFDDSDLMPGVWTPPPPDSSPVPDHYAPRPLFPVPN